MEDKKEKRRFIQYILDEPDRFLPYAFKENPNMKDFGDFDSSFKKAFPKQRYNITTDELIPLFETSECKKRMKNILSKEEYENIYGDGHEVIYTTEDNKVIKTEIIKIKSHGYSVNGKEVRGYQRTKPQKFSNVETKFIQVRKQKNLSPKQIINEYNHHFAESPRTQSSIRSKIYRA